jgi:hypothetical protein
VYKPHNTAATTLVYKKLPKYRVPVFYMALGLNDFDAGKSITRAQKFQGSPLPMPLVMDVARLKIITYRAI